MQMHSNHMTSNLHQPQNVDMINANNSLKHFHVSKCNYSITRCLMLTDSPASRTKRPHFHKTWMTVATATRTTCQGPLAFRERSYGCNQRQRREWEGRLENIHVHGEKPSWHDSTTLPYNPQSGGRGGGAVLGYCPFSM